MSLQDYQQLVREAFIQPIRSVLIVDDDYPTLHEILMDDKEREKKYAHKEWHKAEVREKVRKIIEQFRTPDSPYLLDIHDGSSPSEETDEKQVRILHQTDLLILDYQLEKEKENDGSAAVRIAREALLNKHFNLILVHTQEPLERVFYEFLFGFLQPIYSIGERVTVEAELQAFLNDNEDALIASVSSSQYAASRLGAGDDLTKLNGAINEGTAPWGATKAVLDAGGLSQNAWPDAIRYALEVFEDNNASLFSQEDLGVVYWSDEGIRFIRAARGFVAFKSKDDEEELMSTMLRALVAWDPRPPRLMLTKLRAEMNERGIEVQDDALGQPEVGAIWYRNLLKADDRNLSAMIDRTVRNHAEQLLDKLLPNVSKFAARIRAVDVGSDLSQVILDRFKINLADSGTLSEARMGHNAFVGSKPIKSSHLELGHILRVGADYWVCLTPTCDMVPKVQRGEPYDHIDGLKRFVAVKLVPRTAKEGLKSANHGGQVFVNLVSESGEVERKAFSVAKDSKASPTWMTMYVQDDGYLPSEGELKCKVSYIAASSSKDGLGVPEIKASDAVVCGMLRYEYALEVQSKFVASQSRIGLDFEGA